MFRHLKQQNLHAIEAPRHKITAARKEKKLPEVRGRKWIDNELNQFAIVPVDDKNEFALRLKTLALEKSVNIHIFKTELDARLNEKKGNEESSSKKGRQITIDTSIPKLRVKYKGMKDYSPVSCLKKKSRILFVAPNLRASRIYLNKGN